MDHLYDELALTTLSDVATRILKDDSPENLKRLLDLAEAVIPLPSPTKRELRICYRSVIRFPFPERQIFFDEMNNAYAYAERRREEYLKNTPDADTVSERLRLRAMAQITYERAVFPLRLECLANLTDSGLQRLLQKVEKEIPSCIIQHSIIFGYLNLTTCLLNEPDEIKLKFLEIEKCYDLHGAFRAADRLRTKAFERLSRECIIS